MESFWGTLKNELVHHRRYTTRTQTMAEITEYIEIFYNRQRQARLGYLYSSRFYTTILPAATGGMMSLMASTIDDRAH